MNPFQERITELAKKFTVSEPFYLSSFFEQDGAKRLYDFLESVYKPEYENNFRILIVQDCADHYDYADMPGRAISTLQKYASNIDISNFFILVITNNQNIETELQQVQKFYSTDRIPLQFELIESAEDAIEFVPQDTFCVLPWMHLYVGPDGNVLPCCQGDQQFPIGNIKDRPITDIIKSPRFDQIRRNMVEGRRSKECSRCYAQEDAGLPSGRIFHNSNWKDIRLQDLDPSGKLESIDFRYFDIRLSNVCNLKCRMCSGYFSSAIAQEEIELFGKHSSVDSSLRFKQRQKNLDEILDYIPMAEKIYFAGGEPLLSDEHYKILQKLIDCNNTDLEIIYNTNFTTLHYRSINVLDLWKKFSNITIGASLDAHGKTAEYVRHGCDWNVIESNLELLKSHCPHVHFTVTSTVGILNVSSLIDLQKTWHEDQKLDISNFSLSPMIGPDHLTLTALPINYKKIFDEKIKKHIKWCAISGGTKLASQWQDLLTYMWSKDTSYNLKEFRRLSKLMDSHRSESLEQIIPELKELL